MVTRALGRACAAALLCAWSPEETVVSGDLAYQRGTFVVVSRPKAGGAESRITGNFLRIYRKIDGRWFMVRDSFNSQQPRRPG